MLNHQLIDILNSGDAWAFVGSGCSIDAGLPSWEELLIETMRRAGSSLGALPPRLQKNCQEYHQKNRLIEAFSVLKAHYGSVEIDSIVSGIFLSSGAEPGDITRTVAEWPFASYVTTNYDNLLERALSFYGGWVAIGNTADENAKISRDVRQVVWHPHGGAHLGLKNTRLVLASSDYEEIYPAGSPTLAALEAVCRMKRIVFVGFGFKDPDLVTLLQRISHLITPARPAFGFLANCTQRDREEYWKLYKIDIIPYSAKGKYHLDLFNEMNAYGAFVLDRKSRFGQPLSTPDYDIDTVGLLTHNRLCRSDWTPDGAAADSIAKGLVLAKLRITSPLSIDQLVGAIPNLSSAMATAVRRVVNELIAKDYITDTRGDLSLSTRGGELARLGKTDYELARDQFQLSVLSRANEECPEKSIVQNVCDVTVRYLEQTCKNRGLGIAQQLIETGDIESHARAISLMQGAKYEIEYASNHEAALAVIRCIMDVLSAPRLEEKRYLGALTQAYFGRHLLGIDPATVRIQRTNLLETVFIADSSFIIPLLAEGSVGHEYALTLYEKLVSLNCQIVTSDYLLEETVEHGRWAWCLLSEHGSISSVVVDVARGVRGYKPNAFLVGYLSHPKFGPGAPWKQYFDHTLDSGGAAPSGATVASALRRKGIVVQPYDAWRGFDNDLFTERDQAQEEIEQRRRRNSTYTHPRQVKAEAEVAVIVTQIRNRRLTLDDRNAHDAYFISHSRVVDDLPHQAHRVCLTPESLLEWILSIGELREDEASAVFDQLLWAIAAEGILIVSRSNLLRMFHNTIDVSREKLDNVVSEHREIVRELYTEDQERAFSDVDPLALPGLADEVSQKVLNIMKARLNEERRRRVAAEDHAMTSIKDVKEYERLKAEKAQRKAKAMRKKRAAQSKPKRKKH